jgi:uncharacterized membrane protein
VYAGILACVGGPLEFVAVRWRRAVLQQVVAREGVVDTTTAKRKDISRMQQSRLNQEEKADHAEDNPALSHVVERNIRTIIQLRLRAARERSVQNRIADAITAFSGRMVFVYVHIVWFGVWIVLNTGRVGVRPFDPFPYGLLTMVVSLEAIFLSTLVLISQNRLSAESEHRADLALHIGLLTEYELTRVLHMLDAIQDKMGIDNDADSELADLEMETKPEDVLTEIERLQQRALRSKKPPA